MNDAVDSRDAITNLNTSNAEGSKSLSLEFHRLMDEAQKALEAVEALAVGSGISLDQNNRILGYSLEAFKRDNEGRRFVYTTVIDRMVRIDIDEIHNICSSRLKLAAQYGVSEQDILEFERLSLYRKDYFECACNSIGCSVKKTMRFRDPAQMKVAKSRASTEIWFCTAHQISSFMKEGAISDEYVALLSRIKANPGMTLSDTGSSKAAIEFLKEVGLISVGALKLKTRIVGYQIYITEQGERILSRMGSLSPELSISQTWAPQGLMSDRGYP